MGKTKKILVEKQVIRRFMVKEFKEIPKHKIIDVIPSIVASRPSEVNTLATWEKHFRDSRVPYVVTERKVDHYEHGKVKIRTLWKEGYTEGQP